MANELTTQERRFEKLVQDTRAEIKDFEKEGVRHRHRVGKHAAKLRAAGGRNTYGDATVITLARALAELEGDESRTDSFKQYLYQSMRIYDYDPDFERLGPLCDLGMGVGHLRELLAIDNEDHREQIEARMIVDGQLVPCRELPDIIAEVTRGRITQETEEVMAATGEQDADDEDEDMFNGPEATGPQPTPEVELDPTPPDNEPGAAEEAAAAPAQNTAAPATGRPTNPDRTIASPNAAVTKIEKLITRAHATLGDGFIAIQQVAQEGFDSDRANERWLTTLRALNASISAFIEPALELRNRVNSELQAGDAPADI